jgi:cytoskeletal protein CcmA (bactofilin family)
MVALLLVATIAGATGMSAWRAMRAARLAWNGERATQAADEAIARSMASWDSEAFAARPVGARWSDGVNTVNGGAVALALARLAPLVVVVEASSSSRVSGAPDTASRRVTRVMSLDAPSFPLRGAMTVLGDAEVGDGAVVDGRDDMWVSDGCGPVRDTASVAGVFAGTVLTSAGSLLYGTPASIALGAGAPLDPERAAFQDAFAAASARIQRRDAIAPATALTAGTPWTARIVTSNDALLAEQVTLAGTSRHDGLLVIDGDLQLQGALHVKGLLVVSGALDARGGTLDVDGGVIVRDSRALGTHIGEYVRIRHSPCLVGRALATVARPRIAPFTLWIAR